MGNGGMFAQNQLRLSIFLLSKVARWAEREPSNPIASSNCGVSSQVKKIDIFAHGEIIDAAAFLHDEARWKNPGKANPATRVNCVTELLFEKRAPHSPREKETH